MKVLLWRGLAVVFTGTGVLGIFLPLLPTTVFLILAAWAGKHGWPELEERLLDHPKYGPSIIRWREHGIVPRKAKWAASATMVISLTFIWLGPVNHWVAIGVTTLLAAIATWLWTRPSQPLRRTHQTPISYLHRDPTLGVNAPLGVHLDGGLRIQGRGARTIFEADELAVTFGAEDPGHRT